MNAFETAQNTVDARLKSCSGEIETWYLDHKLAMAVFDYCDLVNDTIEIYSLIDHLNRSYVDQIACGTAFYDENLDNRMSQLCEAWLTQAYRVVKLLPEIKSFGHEVENEPRLMVLIATAEQSKEFGFDKYATELMESRITSLDSFRSSRIPYEKPEE